VALLLTGCAAPSIDSPPLDDLIDVGPGVSLSLAEWRSQAISDLRYRIFLSIPAERQQPITGSILASFSLATTERSLPFDFAAPAENLLAVSGRGIMLMRTFMDEVKYNAKGNAVTLIKHAEPE